MYLLSLGKFCKRFMDGGLSFWFMYNAIAAVRDAIMPVCASRTAHLQGSSRQINRRQSSSRRMNGRIKVLLKFYDLDHVFIIPRKTHLCKRRRKFPAKFVVFLGIFGFWAGGAILAYNAEMHITEEQKQDILRLIEAGRPLPDKYRFLLFDHKGGAELVWEGKSGEVGNVSLPFQTVEQVDEPRTESHIAAAPFLFDGGGRQLRGWTNKLIWGDNKLVLSSLAGGALREEIEKEGGLKLIYIDPPFDVGADFSMEMEIGGEEFTKAPNVLEQIAYRDTWGRAENSYIAMIYERLLMMHDLLADDGSIYVHCDWRVNSYIRLVLDEIFGKGNFVNEIVWHYTGNSVPAKCFPRKHDSVLFYAKEQGVKIYFDRVLEDYSELTLKRYNHIDEEGRRYKISALRKGVQEKVYAKDGKYPDDVWNIPVPRAKDEVVGYPTQKPEALLEKIIKASSNEGDIIADFFCGSGTTAAVAEKLGRKWLAADLGKFAIHTTRKRLIAVQRQMKAEEKDYRAFALLNLGKYERQYFTATNPRLSPEERELQARQKWEDYVKLILRAYRAQPLENDSIFDGKKSEKMVAVGPFNVPASHKFVENIINECAARKIAAADILAFEFEMGIFPRLRDEAKEKGIAISPKYIPPEVFDKRAVEKNEVAFYDVAHIEIKPYIKKTKTGRAVWVELANFSTHYTQERDAKPGKVYVENGKAYKAVKEGEPELLTKHWSDWVDYWAVDFDYESRPAAVRLQNEEGKWEERRTGEFIFENEWQSFRTRKNRNLELASAEKDTAKERIKIAVKVVDIFGNDTMKVLEV